MQVVEQLKHTSPERFLAIYESLAQNGFGPLDGEVAKALRFRPQAIRKLPMEQRARRARALLERGGNAQMTYELFGGYLMKTQKELVTSFLDATGVAHEDGMIEDVAGSLPDAAKIETAVEALDARFPPEDVTLYLSMCAEQWPGVTEIDRIWRARLGADQPA
jgi:hypothetical protein